MAAAAEAAAGEEEKEGGERREGEGLPDMRSEERGLKEGEEAAPREAPRT